MIRRHLQQICLFLTGKTLLELVIEQFEDLLVRILLLAACISFVSIKIYFLSKKWRLFHREKNQEINGVCWVRTLYWEV